MSATSSAGGDDGSTDRPEPLAIKDCTETALATGREARTLRELGDRLREAPDGCLYYHFWGRLLRPVFQQREFNNDFANWVAFQLRDRVLAERLALLDPADFPETSALREELVELVEERLAEEDAAGFRVADEGFHFLYAELVAFETPLRIATPDELAERCADLSPGSIYYHFVDARQRNADGIDDFQRWLGGFGDRYDDVCDRLRQIDVSFHTLDELQEEITELVRTVPVDGGGARG